MTWEEEAAAIIAKIDQTIPAEADIKERKRALREGRVRQYRQQHPEGIELVVSVPGDRDLEAVLLEHLSGSNSVGEWFEPTMEVLSMVETLERVAKRRRGHIGDIKSSDTAPSSTRATRIRRRRR